MPEQIDFGSKAVLLFDRSVMGVGYVATLDVENAHFPAAQEGFGEGERIRGTSSSERSTWRPLSGFSRSVNPRNYCLDSEGVFRAIDFVFARRRFPAEIPCDQLAVVLN
jgi:hypothetical protein